MVSECSLVSPKSVFYQKNNSHRCSPKHQSYSQATKAHKERTMCFISVSKRPHAKQTATKSILLETTTSTTKNKENPNKKQNFQCSETLKSWCVMDVWALRLLSKARFRRSKLFIQIVHKSYKYDQRDLLPPRSRKISPLRVDLSQLMTAYEFKTSYNWICWYTRGI